MDIIRKLLDPNPETRLGCGKNGAKDIKDHPFFAKEINFNLLIRMKEEAPVKLPARIFSPLMFANLAFETGGEYPELSAGTTYFDCEVH